jgi:ABC-2 type transport system permease protein
MSNGVSLAIRQVRAENRAFWRNPAAAFFTFAFPLIFMVVFNVLFAGNAEPGAVYTASDFFTPAIVALSVITACYTNIAMTITSARDEGILKRVRGTPLPDWAYMAGRIGQSVLVSVLLVVIVSAFGSLAYGVEFPIGRLPFLLAALVLGAATFCALGIAVSGFIPNADAAPAIVNVSILPLLFISNVFAQVGEGFPAWIDTVSKIFPIRHFADLLHRAWDPRITDPGFDPVPWTVLGVWLVVGVVVARRFFTWEPRT